MSERYTRLFLLPEKLYTQGAPVIIAAGALLKDNVTGRVLAQLKFTGLCDKTIVALRASVSAFDVAGTALAGDSNFSYLDLSIARDTAFGQNTPILLPDANTRSISAAVTEVFFADKQVWRAGDGAVWSPLPAPESPEQALEPELAAQYRRDMTGQTLSNIPAVCLGLWSCACGGMNRADESCCHRCGAGRDAVFSACSAKTLAENLERHLAAEAEANEQRRLQAMRQAEADKIAAAKLKKTLTWLLPSLAAVIAAVLLVMLVIVPGEKYKDAQELLAAGDCDGAAAAFAAAGDYKDARERSLASYYAEGEALLAAGDHGGAAAAFAAAGDYKDAQEKRMEAMISELSGTVFSAGSNHTVGLRADGTVVAVGDNEYGRCDVEDWSDIVAVSAGWCHTVGLRADGTVVAVGDNEYGKCDVEDWSDIVAVSAGDDHTVGLRADGTVVAVGNNEAGQCDVGYWDLR